MTSSTSLTEEQQEAVILFHRLRMLETNAFSTVVNAFRAQGDLSWDKLKLLEELRMALHISPLRHRAELLRAETDTTLQKLAMHDFAGTYQNMLIISEQQHSSTTTAAATAAGGHDDSFEFHESDTDSEHEGALANAPNQVPIAPRKRGPKAKSSVSPAAALPGIAPQVADAGTVRKRGRKPKAQPATPAAPVSAASLDVSPSAFDEEGEKVAKRPRQGKSPAAGGTAQRGRKRAATATTTAATAATPAFPSLDDLTDEQLEKIAEDEHAEVERLEQLIKTATDDAERAELQRSLQEHRDRLVELIHKLEASIGGEE